MSDTGQHSESSISEADAVSTTPRSRRRWSWWRAPDLAGLNSFWREQKLEPWWSWWHLLELAAVFAVGACLMNFLYVQAEVAGGVSGHDSWYHVKMAELLPEIGATGDFPWLRHVYFTKTTSEFVSHHFGFHVLLVPFVQAAKWLGGDALTGGRWAISAFFAASLTLFHLILMTQRVRCRWLWLGLYLLMPSQFFSRQAFVRAIAPSLMFMFAIMVLMFRRRYFWAGLAVAAYTQLYLGGVVYAPLVVVCYAIAGLAGPGGDRVSWRLWLWTALGWLVGVHLYPYSQGMFEFLHLQIFGSGLTPDISVGREWKPYGNVWWLARASAWTLIPLALAASLRLRLGPRVSARELSVLLMSLVFGALMLKSRRFVEYWPPFALLAAALLAGPILGTAVTKLTDWLRSADDLWSLCLPAAGLTVICAGVIAQVVVDGRDLHINSIRDHWQIWALLAGGYLLVPLSRFWLGTRAPVHTVWQRIRDATAFLLAGAVFVTAVAGVLRLALGRPNPTGARLFVPWWCFAGVAFLYLLVPIAARAGGPLPRTRSPAIRLAGVGAILMAGLTFVVWLIAAAGPQMVSLQRTLKPKFDLGEIQLAMDALVEASDPGDLVLTDDWDVFPVYFYVNHHNTYCVGLDPKFTHDRDPVLWERYKIITRGQTPKWYQVPQEQRIYVDGGVDRVRVRLEDIRDFFGAQYVIVDKDHSSFRRKLEAADEFCERIYPPPEPQTDTKPGAGRKTRDQAPPYAVYRVFSRREQAAAEEAAEQARAEKAKRTTEHRRVGPIRPPTTRPAVAPSSQPVGD